MPSSLSEPVLHIHSRNAVRSTRWINWHTTLFFDHNRGQENSSAGPAIGGGNGPIYGDDRSRPIKLGEPEDDGDDWARTLELLKEGDSAG